MVAKNVMMKPSISPGDTVRGKACSNEKKIKALFRRKVSHIKFLGKRRYARDGVEISVDEAFRYKGNLILLEVDSGNYAKLLVGQYVLLNILSNENKENCFFLVVHLYKKYNPCRTLRNLRLVNERIFNNRGIEFGAINLKQLEGWNGDMLSLFEMAVGSVADVAEQKT